MMYTYVCVGMLITLRISSWPTQVIFYWLCGFSTGEIGGLSAQILQS